MPLHVEAWNKLIAKQKFYIFVLQYVYFMPLHVEAWNKLIAKQTFCASSWLITEINDVVCYKQNATNTSMKLMEKYRYGDHQKFSK